jgi:Na+-translocating ferredoxin:NAD+ oxidoreductase RnfD subunit
MSVTVARVIKRRVANLATHAFPRSIKGQTLMALLMILGVAIAFEPTARFTLVVHVAVALFATILMDAPFLRAETGRWQLPTSGLLTGLIVAMILAPGTPLDVVATAGVVSILGKRLIRVGGRHVFNPAIVGLTWVGWQFGAGQSWWGALANAPIVWVGLLILCGWLIADRINKGPIALTFLGSYLGLWTIASFSPLTDAQLAAEMFRAPFIQSALYLALFMLTDPPTSPNVYSEQVWYGLIAGTGSIVASMLGAGQLYLLVGTAGANVWLAGQRLRRHHRAGPVVSSTPALRQRAAPG